MSVDTKEKQLEQPNTLVHPETNPVARRSTRKWLFSLAPVLAIAFLLAVFSGWQYLTSREETDDAYIDGHMSSISARVAGTVTNVYVTDNQLVKVGDLIAKLDSRDFEAKVEQSKAQAHLMQGQLDQTIASLAQATKNADAQITQSLSDRDAASANVDSVKSTVSQNVEAVHEKRSQIQSQEAKLRLAHSDYDRYLQLDSSDAVSKQELEQKRTDYEVAQAQLQAEKDSLRQTELKVFQAKSQLIQAKAQVARSYGLIKGAEATQEQVNVINKQIAAAKASFDQANAQLKEDLLRLSYCTIRAPIVGRIGRKNLEVGNHVDIGQNLVSVVAPEPWIIANFKETQTARMKPGQKVEISVDGLPGMKLKGRIESLSPTSGAKFALLPPENATGNFTKVVQRIPVKIVFAEDLNQSIKSRLAPGMSCVVAVIVR